MTTEQRRAESERLELLPCPFCGERLVLHGDHHGEWWGHKNDMGPCFDSVAQVMDQKDANAWNTRGGKLAALEAEVGHEPKETNDGEA